MSMPPILVADLFPEITLRLVALLRSLTPDEWSLPTSSSRRTVKDVVSHLLDGSLRRLSIQRDGYVAPGDSGRPSSEETLVGYLDRLNDEYESRFGFRFVVFVAGRPRDVIAEVMQAHLDADPDAEKERGLRDVVAIARDRAPKLAAAT